MKKIIISGGSGFLGQSLKLGLESRGFSVKITSRQISSHFIHLDYENPPKDLSPYEGFDCWIHLAGENIEALRWTSKKRRKILFSRLNSGQTVREIIKQLKHPPSQIFVASGAGYYGYESEISMDESSPRGKGFLALVAEEVENSWKDFFIKPVLMRIAPVFSYKQGVLKKLSTLWNLGVIAYFGNPNNYFPYVEIEELINMNAFMIGKKLSGPFNLVSAVPKKQKEVFTKFFKNKPKFTFLVPQWLIKPLLGEFGRETILTNIKITPKRLLDAGFKFLFEGISDDS